MAGVERDAGIGRGLWLSERHAPSSIEGDSQAIASYGTILASLEATQIATQLFRLPLDTLFYEVS